MPDPVAKKPARVRKKAPKKHAEAIGVPVFPVMGLDLSCTGTGIVVVEESGEIALQAVTGVPLDADSRTRDRTERLVAIARDVLRVAQARLAKNSSIVIEGYAFNAKGAQNDLAEVHGVVRVQLHLAGFVNVEYRSVTRARSRVLGKGWGGKPKPEVKKELALRGRTFRDDNLMDAWVLVAAEVGIATQPPAGEDE